MKRRQNTVIDASVNLNDCTATEPHKMMIVIFGGRPMEALAELARTATVAQVPILLVPYGSHSLPDDDQIPNLQILDKGHHLIVDPVIAACQAARHMGVTHLVFLHPLRSLMLDDMAAISGSIKKTPDAVVVGRSDPAGNRMSLLMRLGRKLASICYRLKTGRQLDDVNSGVCAFPLTALELLTWNRRAHLFMVQAPVKASWAGVEIGQTTISSARQINGRSLFGWAAIGHAVTRWMMHFHLTMRAITPWPHRKIIKDASTRGEKISVLHPMRAVKNLLTENTTPWQLCLAAALGVFIGALPLIATHTIVILFAAGYLRLNKVAALTASQICMPPLVPAICIEAGHFLRSGKFLTEISLETIGYQALERLYEWFLGALLLGPLLALFAGGVVFGLAALARRKMISD